MSIRVVSATAVGVYHTRLPLLLCRSYAQNPKISCVRAFLNALKPKNPNPSSAPQYKVLTKAECEKHDEQLWNKELKKASEEFKNITKKT